jgi:hypothetical protein
MFLPVKHPRLSPPGSNKRVLNVCSETAGCGAVAKKWIHFFKKNGC